MTDNQKDAVRRYDRRALKVAPRFPDLRELSELQVSHFTRHEVFVTGWHADALRRAAHEQQTKHESNSDADGAHDLSLSRPSTWMTSRYQERHSGNEDLSSHAASAPEEHELRSPLQSRGQCERSEWKQQQCISAMSQNESITLLELPAFVLLLLWTWFRDRRAKRNDTHQAMSE